MMPYFTKMGVEREESLCLAIYEKSAPPFRKIFILN